MTSISDITHIVFTGSVDGQATSAALMNKIGHEVSTTPTQAFEVDKIDVDKLPANSVVAFVDLAVNNKNRQMTADFVARLIAAGHKLVAVIDEHSREDWLEVLGTFEGLIIEPQSQAAGVFKSSGAILKAALGELASELAIELCDDADAGDRMDFSTHFGGLINMAIKSDIFNNARRMYMVKHFAFNREPDAQIVEWAQEYDKVIIPNHLAIKAAAKKMYFGMVRVVTTGMKIDMTTLMSDLYKNYRIVVLEGMAFNPAEKKQTLQVSIGTNDKTLDLLACVKAAGITPLGGFAAKVNVELKDEKKALVAIRKMLRKKIVCSKS